MALKQLLDLTGRTALITGGSAGIGGSLARLLALAGARVMMVARRESELQASIRELVRGAALHPRPVGCYACGRWSPRDGTGRRTPRARARQPRASTRKS